MTLSLAAAVRRMESSDGAAVMRFERGCLAALEEGRGELYALRPEEVLRQIAAANRCSPDTARMIFATSWGDYQDMGFEIYGELCLPPDPVPGIREWLADKELQDRAMARWCRLHGFDSAGPLPGDAELARFARLYNGPGQVETYVALVKKAAAALAA